MVETIRDHIRTSLAAQRLCVVSAHGAQGACSLPAAYSPHGLQIDCLLPRWAEVTFALERDPRATVVIPPARADGDIWLQLRGMAHPVGEPDWATLLQEPRGLAAPADLYAVMRVCPSRIDLLDGARGWRVHDTLELV